MNSTGGGWKIRCLPGSADAGSQIPDATITGAGRQAPRSRELRVAPHDPGVMCGQARAAADVKADTPAVNRAGLVSAGNVPSIPLNGYRKAQECRFLVSAPGPAKRLTDADQG